MRKAFLFFSGFIMLISILGCNEESNTAFMPPITGKAGELLVIIEDNLWSGKSGDRIFEIFSTEEPGLPQSGTQTAEPIFEVVNIPPVALSHIFKTHRNILYCFIDKKYDTLALINEEDYWAKEQKLIKLYAPNVNAFLDLLDENEEFLVKEFKLAERNRQIRLNKKYENINLGQELYSNFNLNINFPSGFKKRKIEDDFAWIEMNEPDVTLGVFIWTYPYESENQLLENELIQKRDQELKKHVPGPSKGSYMTTELEFPLSRKELLINDHYAVQTNGLWKVEGDFMGGPFVSATFVDEKNNRLVCADGWVFAPKYDKRNYLRRVESILYTMNFTPRKE